MTTRERIIETALSLFNAQGTAPVSTNHIAAACGISPGNLYYHFRNKEEIIRAIFGQMVQVGIEEYQAINGPGTAEGTTALTAMLDTFVMVQRFNWRYRFFKRELTALLQHDPQLAAEFTVVHHAHRQMVRDAIVRSITEGFVAPLAADELERLAEQVWLIVLFWLNYLEVGGEEVDDTTLARGTAVLASAIRPHLTAEARAAMAAAAGQGEEPPHG